MADLIYTYLEFLGISATIKSLEIFEMEEAISDSHLHASMSYNALLLLLQRAPLLPRCSSMLALKWLCSLSWLGAAILDSEFGVV